MLLRLGPHAPLEREPLVRFNRANRRPQHRILSLFYRVPRFQLGRVQVRDAAVFRSVLLCETDRPFPSDSNKYFRSTPLDYPLVSLSGYLHFWAVAFVAVTAYLAFFQPEVSLTRPARQIFRKKQIRSCDI